MIKVEIGGRVERVTLEAGNELERDFSRAVLRIIEPHLDRIDVLLRQALTDALEPEPPGR